MTKLLKTGHPYVVVAGLAVVVVGLLRHGSVELMVFLPGCPEGLAIAMAMGRSIVRRRRLALTTALMTLFP